MASYLKRGLWLAAAGALLALPRAAVAGCGIVVADRDGNGTLDVRLSGDSGKQIAVVEIHNDGSFLATIDCNHDGDLLDTVDRVASGAGPVESFFVELLGNDEVTVAQADDLVGASRNVVLVAGSLATSFSYDSQGHGILGNSRLGIEVIGGNRPDAFHLDLAGSTIASSSVIVRGDLGALDDVFTMVGPAQVTGSNLDVAVDLGFGGNDVVVDDGGLLATGSDVLLDVQGGEDAINADLVDAVIAGRYEGGSRLLFDAPLGNGLDRFSAQVDTTSFGVDTSGAAGSSVELRVTTGPGEDSVSLLTSGGGVPEVNGLVEASFDLGGQRDEAFFDWDALTGSGTLRLRMAGSSASDVLLASVVTSAGSQNDVDAIVGGNAELDFVFEGDTVYLAIVDLGGNASFGPGGAAIVSGGVDFDDFCAYFGNGPSAALGCEAGS